MLKLSPDNTCVMYYYSNAVELCLCLQGDKEAELGLPFSPLCDRKSTMVAQSQIGE